MTKISYEQDQEVFQEVVDAVGVLREKVEAAARIGVIITYHIQDTEVTFKGESYQKYIQTLMVSGKRLIRT